jgi:branched-chain amino acid transport system ATP-binding protein
VQEHLALAYRVRVARHRLWTDMVNLRAFRPPAGETERVDELLELLRLTRVRRAPVAALPLGLSRLVELGRALACDPHVVLLDEPLSGLDLKAAENVLGVFRGIVEESERELSLLIVEHDVAAVLSLSKWIFVLDFGERIAAGEPAEIRANPHVRAAYLGDEDPVGRPIERVAAGDHDAGPP